MVVGPGRPADTRRRDSVVADCRGAAAALGGQTRRSDRGRRASWLTRADHFRPCGNDCRSDRGGRNNGSLRGAKQQHSSIDSLHGLALGYGNTYETHVDKKSHTGKCRRRNRTTTMSSSARRHTTNERPLSYDLLVRSHSTSHHRRKNYLDVAILLPNTCANTSLCATDEILLPELRFRQ